MRLLVLVVVYAFVLNNIASADFLLTGRYSSQGCNRPQLIELLSQNSSFQTCNDLLGMVLTRYGQTTGCFADKYKANVWTQITCSATNQFNTWMQSSNLPSGGIVTTTYLTSTCDTSIVTPGTNIFSQLWQATNTCTGYANVIGSSKITKL